MVVDPHHFVAEVEKLRRAGHQDHARNAAIADNAPLILSLHRELDAIREERQFRPQDRHHQRGIGPAYEDKVGRRAIRV